MTKSIRVENADTSQYQVSVYVETKVDGKWVRLKEVKTLDFPTQMLTEYIHNQQRLVIEETE